jgi:hypothetical protein
VRHHTLEDVGDLGGVEVQGKERRGRPRWSAGEGDGGDCRRLRAGEEGASSGDGGFDRARMGLRPGEEGASTASMQISRRAAAEQSESGHQRAEQSGVDADLQAGGGRAEREWAPARGAERRRCRSSRDRARAESSGGEGGRGKKSRPAKRYFAKCQVV